MQQVIDIGGTVVAWAVVLLRLNEALKGNKRVLKAWRFALSFALFGTFQIDTVQLGFDALRQGRVVWPGNLVIRTAVDAEQRYDLRGCLSVQACRMRGRGAGDDGLLDAVMLQFGDDLLWAVLRGMCRVVVQVGIEQRFGAEAGGQQYHQAEAYKRVVHDGVTMVGYFHSVNTS